MPSYSAKFGNYKLRFADVSCRLRISSGVSTTTSVGKILDWNLENAVNQCYDTGELHDQSTNPSRITIKIPGKYIINLNIDWAIDNSGIRQATILSSGSSIAATKFNAGSAGSTLHSLSAIVQAGIGDYYEAQVVQSSGGDLDVDAVPATNFSIQRITS